MPQLSAPVADAGQRRRIALLGYRSHPYSGGQGIYLHYLSKALIAQGHHVDVISGPPYPDLVPGVGLIKLPSLDLYAADNHVTALRPRHLTSFTDTFEYLSMLTGGFPEPYTFGRRLMKWYRSNRPVYDIVHDNQSLCYGVLGLQQQGVPVVTTIHHPITWDRDLALNAAADWKARLLIRRWHSFIGMQTRVARDLKHVVTVSSRSREDIIDAFGLDPARVTVVHNGIDTQTFRPLPHIEREDRHLIATASADQPLKGLRFLVAAIARLKPTFPDVRLTVIGQLKENGPADKIIEREGLRDSITFVSNLTTSEIVEHYARATLAVCPSLYEGFGFPAGEAMACGVPVVSTDGGALPEVVGDAGEIVPAGDADALATAIGELLSDKQSRLRLGEAGRQRITTCFNWDVAARNMVSVYEMAMSGTRVA